MKKSFWASSVCLAAALVVAASLLAPKSKSLENPGPDLKENSVVTVSKSEMSPEKTDKLLESRFLNMLKHSFVYDADFESVESVVNGSMPALLNLREGDFISEAFVADYVFNMYGIEVENFGELNRDFPSKEGYVYIIPRGFTKYEHSAVSVTENEDGSYTVETKVTAEGHDSEAIVETCTTLFVPNESSSFGFNIVYSNISGNEFAV